MVVDYMQASSRPPSFSGVGQQPERGMLAEIIDYTQSAPGPSTVRRELDFSQVPAHIRRDRVQAEGMARAHAQEDELAADVSSWDELQARSQQDRTVNFGRPADSPSLRGNRGQVTASPYAAAILGQAVRPPARQQNRGPQQVPHLIV